MKKKLFLRAETIRLLTKAELTRLAGGDATNHTWCCDTLQAGSGCQTGCIVCTGGGAAPTQVTCLCWPQ